MSDSQGRKQDNHQHIQVFARVRPHNHTGIYSKSSTVVEVVSPRECIVRERPHDKLTKKFTFDRVFGPLSKQIDVYNAVVSPLLGEVLAGYNCTVFAYGQTGTGKTFTMEGQSNDPAIHWQSDTTAGIIPRALSHLFDELRLMDTQEYTVRVSFLELYNEELFDLLSPNDDVLTKIRLYEDASKKGAVIIHGLEEVTVHSKNEVYNILEKGSEKRQTAATLMNAHSSRSHTVFSITVHIKENTVDGEELLKTGKLNLVDLAGSENVGRSGAVDRRAREAGNINQSLLTLGRVITALVERAPHIPYRESKLTRLLQESLGGRTKTSIIATVSPASINLEETLSTLDYAHRAKNITNRPEINQKLSKKALLKEYTEEIERLRRDLQATRERNGVYLAHDNYNEMQATIDFQGKEIEQKINHIKALEETMAAKEKLLEELKINLATTKHQVKITEQERNEQRYLVEMHAKTESELLQQAKNLLSVAETATVDTFKLHDKIERKRDIEMNNETIGEKFKDNIAVKFDAIRNDLSDYVKKLMEFYSCTGNEICEQKNNNFTFFTDSVHRISRNFIEDHQSVTHDLQNSVELSRINYEKWFDDQINDVKSMSDKEREALKKIFIQFSPKITKLIDSKVEGNFQAIKVETAANLNDLGDWLKNTIGSLADVFIHEINSLKQKLQVFSNEVEIAQKLSEESMSDAKEFAEIWKKWHEREIQRQLRIIELSKSGINQYKNANIHIDKILANHTDMKSIIDDNLCPNMKNISEKLSEEIETNCKLIENSVEQSKIVAIDLKKELEKNCGYLSNYENRFEAQAINYKQKIQSDCSLTLSLINKNHQIISEVSNYHEEATEKHRKKSEDDYIEINGQFEKQKLSTTDWSEKMLTHLVETQNEIQQFWNEDLKRDVATGLTPIKREFSYPRQLIATSPHERILCRYRQQEIPSNINESCASCPQQNNIQINDQLQLPTIEVSNITNVPSSQEIVIYDKENCDSDSGTSEFIKTNLRPSKYETTTQLRSNAAKRILSSRNQ